MKKSSRGFTLIELLVVMVILGILATLGVGSFQTSQQKSRDARRKSDLKQIGIALEAYYNDYGEYPLSSAGFLIDACAGGTACDWATPFQDDNGTLYMAELPADPRPTLMNYYYESAGPSFQLYARLENSEDPSIPRDAQNDPLNFGIDCGNANCNFGIASANTTPAAGRSLVAE